MSDLHRPTSEELEAMRQEVAFQMLRDPDMKERVERMVGKEQARKRYWEAYPE